MRRERIEDGIYRLESGRLQVVRQAPTPTGGRRTISETVNGIREARRVRARLDAEISSGAIAADAHATLRGHVETVIAHRATLGKIRPGTEARYHELVERHVFPIVGGVKLGKLSAVQLQAVVDRMVAGGVDPRQTVAVLRMALGQAVRWKLIAFNPAAGIELPTRRRPELTLPTREELERILAGAGDVTEPFRAALTIAVTCGLRRSEIFGLRWSDVDLAEGVAHVRRGVHAIRRPGGTELLELAPKTDRGERAVEIPAAAVAELERYKAAQTERRLLLGGAWAADWPTPDVVIDDGVGRPMNPDALSRRFGRLKARLGVRPEIRFHDLRALYVTEALAAGVDAGTVSRQAGHSTVSFTHDRYQRPRRTEARAVADAIQAALGDAIRAPSVAPVLLEDSGDLVELRPKRR